MPFLLGLLPIWNMVKAIIGGLISFFTTKPGVYVGIALIAVGAYWWSGHQGYKRGVAFQKQDETTRVAAARLAAADEARRTQLQIDKGIQAAADKAGFLRGKAQAKTITITREIPKYVTVEIDRAFPVPCSLFLLHDAAAIGADPQALSDAACGPDGKTATLKASDLASVIVANYGIDHEKDAQIIGLQDLARSLAQALTGKPAVIDTAPQ